MTRTATAARFAPATMRAAAIVGPGRTSIEEVRVPEPGPGQVRIRLEGCGVCASNLAVWEGKPWFRYPLAPGVPGHEGWGRVDALGEGVTTPRPGQRVATLAGNAYAEYVVAEADEVVRLPAELESHPFPGEPLGCAFNVFRRSRIEAGHIVAVVGVGFLGALLTRLAANTGAFVVGLSRRPFTLELAATLGAAHRIPLDDNARIVERVRDLTGGRLCDRVIECTGQQRPLDLAAEITRERGTLVIAGYHQDGPRQIDMQLWNWRGLDVVNAHERDPKVYVEGMREAVRAVTSGVVDPVQLYTHRYTLDRLGDALDAARDRPDGFLKALVMPAT